MATMRQIRSRIRVAKNIQQITKAMKMVAAARLKRAQDRVQAARPYAEKMREVMGSLAASASGAVDHPLLARREVQNTGILLLTADRGLAGSYNSAIIRQAAELAKDFDPAALKLYIVGKKGNAFFRRRGHNVVESLSINTNNVSFGETAAMTRLVRTAFEKGDIDELYVVYTRFLSALTQRPNVLKLLPIETPVVEPGASRSPPSFWRNCSLATSPPRSTRPSWNRLPASTAPV
jgi:F-type H+-transporting ATPase subunit gamma